MSTREHGRGDNVQDEEDRPDLDTGAKPGHAMLPDMGLYHKSPNWVILEGF